MNCLNDTLSAIKSKYDDPYIFVGGDFNRRSFRAAVTDHPDIVPVPVGATRGTAALDIIASNVNSTLVDYGTVEPIWNEQGIRTDHQTVFALSLIHI